MSVRDTPTWPVRLVAIGLLAGAMVLLWLALRELGMPTSLSATALAEWLRGSGALGPVLLIGLMVMAVVVGPLPTLPVSAASGLAFGLLGGTLVAATGALIGAMIAFFAARVLGRDIVCRYLKNNPLFTDRRSQRVLFWAVLVTRLVPLFSFALVSYAAGITAITAWRFALATLVGMLPMTVVFAGLGHNFQLHPVVTTTAAVALLLSMALLPYYLDRYHRQRIARWLDRSA